jgi:hypothetical protein
MDRRPEPPNDKRRASDPRRKSGTVVDARASLALWLRAGRSQREMSIEDVARITKIQVRILERLEAGKLDGLPAEVFVRGFVRSFARAVGLDEDDALKRYIACGDIKSAVTVAPSPSARAVVEAMADLAPGIAASPSMLTELEPGFAAGSLRDLPLDAMETVMLPETGTLVAAPPAQVDLTALTPEVAPLIAEQPVEAAPPAKKKRARRATSGTAKPRKRKSMAMGTPVEPSPVVAAAVEATAVEPAVAPTEIAPPIASDAEVVTADAIEFATFSVPVPAAEVEVIEEPAIDSTYVPEPPSIATAFDVSDARPIERVGGPAAPGIERGGTLPASPVGGAAAPRIDEPADATWHPKMPPPATTTTSVPWRRPGYATSTVPVASLVAVIDDADPDSAERELEDRRATKEPRRSFLPPILLDREDRSARQGGLTLAVIILLIAATLTLSYLMRRPSSSGDGVTRADTTSISIHA